MRYILTRKMEKNIISAFIQNDMKIKSKEILWLMNCGFKEDREKQLKAILQKLLLKLNEEIQIDIIKINGSYYMIFL